MFGKLLKSLKNIDSNCCQRMVVSGNGSVNVQIGEISVNGKVIQLDNNKAKVDGKTVYADVTKIPEIIINGDVEMVDGTSITINGNVSGDVDGTNIKITGDVNGSIDGTRIEVGGSCFGDIDGTSVHIGKRG